MTIQEAIQQVKSGVRAGVRGPGCAAIVMDDGRRYSATGYAIGELLERFSDEGELIERVVPSEVAGEVSHIEWTCDELGGIYIS